MHDLDFDHGHETPEELTAIADTIHAVDNVDLTTVGVDIGSSTSHLIFSKVRLQRLATALSSRFVVTGRDEIYRSPILFTPYRPDNTIDADSLAGFIDESYREAGLAADDIDSGAVILTGEALKRDNAEAIAHLFAGDAGKFVCASAGHNLECALAAHGSGAVALSRTDHRTVLNIDLGGGTTKLGLAHGGRLLHRAAIEVGGRLVAFDADGRINRIEQPALVHAAAAGITLKMGERLTDTEKTALAESMVDALLPALLQQKVPDHTAGLLVTEPLPAGPLPDFITLSGGVSEFIRDRRAADQGDLGLSLAAALTRALLDGRIPYQVVETGQGIRATVIGASQFTVQVSGNTVAVSNPDGLPLRNIPVLFPAIDLSTSFDAISVADAIRAAHLRTDLAEGSGPVALALRWQGDPSHVRLKDVAVGVAGAMSRGLAAGHPLIVMVDGDMGASLGRVLGEEAGVPGDIIALDGISLQEFDYVDIGEVMKPANVVPLVIKSLLFSQGQA